MGWPVLKRGSQWNGLTMTSALITLTELGVSVYLSVTLVGKLSSGSSVPGALDFQSIPTEAGFFSPVICISIIIADKPYTVT